MEDTLIQNCTVMDVVLFIFGILLLIALGKDGLGIFALICGFILVKAYIRRTEMYQQFSSMTESGRRLQDAEDDWDDDDNLAIGLYD
ncbi:hypothetical protein L0665_03525 [Methanogenium marinum]|uniref:Uncharacterized protein n=1 Tax=Methanogenium marinum TaxID=348610 RepID=A0A9Q4KS24_9EURY|nr:hypothetical protein [Methanogenium marinum]MDE4907682.1 hypothetical protein [Methanogenium marinum]